VTGSPSPYRAGARRAATIAPAVIVFGVSFGLLAQAAGMGALASVVMSATTFAGSAQFAAASVLSAAGSVGAATAAILLNARYVPIGISVASVLRGAPLRRLVEAQLVVDESWAFSRERDGSFDRGVLLGAGLVLYTCWVAGTAAGAIGGEALGDPDSLGLDGAFAALFLALLVLQINSRRALVAALLGGTIAFVLVPVTAPGVPIIAATRAASSAGGRAELDLARRHDRGRRDIACKAVGPVILGAAPCRPSWPESWTCWRPPSSPRSSSLRRSAPTGSSSSTSASWASRPRSWLYACARRSSSSSSPLRA
jgi:4-azaleucine resistance transporter AzlC